jgi:type I restriction enzyme S subunit
MDSSALPENWAAVTLETVAEIHDNLREPVNSTERKSRVGPFPYYGATGQVGWIDDFRQDGEYVLLGEDGAPFFDPTKDKAYLVSGKCWVNNHAHVLKAREGVCLNRYLLYALNQVNYRGFANGTTRLKLTQAAMRQLPINLAPLAEQHRIVAKIEELFSELDQGVASLKTAREQLNVYRQSLLKNAFEGKLTTAWRAAHRDQLETASTLQQRIARERQARYQQQLADWQAAGQPGSKPKSPKPLPPLTAEELAELPELPAGWGWIRVGELVDRVTVGYVGPMKDEYIEEGVPFLRSQNVRENRFDPEGLKFVSRAFHQSLSKSALSAGDVVVVRSGSIGVSCVIPEHLGEANCSDLVIAKKPRHVSPHLLAYYMNWQTQGRVKQKMVGVALIHFNTKSVEGFAYPLCCEQEQQQIEKLLAEKLSEADQLGQTLATALQQADALRQSILKKAFCGQLVKQDINEEPATTLLERIRAARATSPAKGRQAKLVSKSLTNC